MGGHRYHGSVVRTIVHMLNKKIPACPWRTKVKFSSQSGIGRHAAGNGNLSDSCFPDGCFYFIHQHFNHLPLKARANILQVSLNELGVVGFLIPKKIEKRSLDAAE